MIPYTLVVGQFLSRVHLFETTWTAACQASLSFTISRVCSKSCPYTLQWGPWGSQRVGHDWATELNWYSAAAAKLLQSCSTLCDPIDGSTPDFLVLHQPRDSPGKNTGVGCHFKALIFYSASYKIICSCPGSLCVSPFPSFFPLPSIFVLNPLFTLSIPPISLLKNYSVFHSWKSCSSLSKKYGK